MLALKIEPSSFQVLVVDDEESIRSVVDEALKMWGYVTKTADCAETALKMVEQGYTPHVVISDIRMGAINGIQMAKKLKEISEEIEVIIMTSYGSFDTAVEALRAGVHDYLSKPFENIEDIKPVLEHVCRRIYMRYYTEFLIKELQRKNKEIDTLAKLTNDLNKNLQIISTTQIAVEGLRDVFPGASAVYYKIDPELKKIVLSRACMKEESMKVPEFLPTPPTLFDNTPELKTYFEKLGDNKPIVEHLKKGSDDKREFRMQACFIRDIPHGVFVMWKNDWNEDVVHLFKRTVGTVATAFENNILHAKIMQVAIRDGLTGLYNVRHFKEFLDREVALAQRNQKAFSLLFLDIDHFKKYNDQNGHPAGDELLRRFAGVLRTVFRKTDVIARYGGEEFVVFLANTDLAQALVLGEKLRETIQTTAFEHREKQPLGFVSCSMGVAEFPLHGLTPQEVIKAADDALYEAKKTRNAVKGAKTKAQS